MDVAYIYIYIYISHIKKLRNNACNVAIYSYPISKKFKNNAC
jgi:hypothetical protein